MKPFFFWEEPWWTAECHFGGVGISNAMSRRIHRPAPQNSFWCIIFFESRVEISLQGRMTNLKGNQLVIWPPHRLHLFGQKSPRWSHTWTYGRGRMWDRLFGQAPHEEPLSFREWGRPRAFDVLYHECSRRAFPDMEIIRLGLETLAAEIRRLPLSDGANPSVAWISRVESYILSRVSDRLLLGDLARVAGFSVSRFSLLFQEATGRSPMRYVREQRMQMATRLLKNPGLSIKEVAVRVGYPDPLHFSREFHKAFGKSPRACRG